MQHSLAFIQTCFCGEYLQQQLFLWNWLKMTYSVCVNCKPLIFNSFWTTIESYGTEEELCLQGLIYNNSSNCFQEHSLLVLVFSLVANIAAMFYYSCIQHSKITHWGCPHKQPTFLLSMCICCFFCFSSRDFSCVHCSMEIAKRAKSDLRPDVHFENNPPVWLFGKTVYHTSE